MLDLVIISRYTATTDLQVCSNVTGTRRDYVSDSPLANLLIQQEMESSFSPSSWAMIRGNVLDVPGHLVDLVCAMDYNINNGIVYVKNIIPLSRASMEKGIAIMMEAERNTSEDY